MSRPAVLAFLSLASFLVLLPLSLKKPGLPMQLHGGEATWYLMASSLARDGDLRCGEADLAKLFDEFPFANGGRLDVASDDGWQTARFARPVIYPLLAAPFAALGGAGGVVALNALLFLLAIALGWAHLWRWNGDGVALLYAFAFFVLSTAFVYLFRMQPQILVLALVTACLSLGWTREEDGAGSSPGARWWISGGALALASFHEPALALLAAPLLAGMVRRRRRTVAWLAGFASTLAVTALLQLAWTGSAWPDRVPEGVAKRSFTVDSPLELPWQSPDAAADPGSVSMAEARGIGGVLEDASFLLWGRRTGALAYFPLLLPLLFFFGATARRAEDPSRESRQRWMLLATLGVLGLLQLTFEPVSRTLHGAEIGNPHLVGVYPAFLFLLARISPALITASCALGALVLSTLLLTPFGTVVPGSPIHAHTRGFPYVLLPFEYPALGIASGFREIELPGLGDVRLWAPKDQTEMLDEDLWLRGGERVELWLESRGELSSAVFNLHNLAASNRVTLRIGREKAARDFDQVPPEGVSFQAQFEPRRSKVRRDAAGEIHFYRVRVTTRRGEKPKWRMNTAGNDYLGIALSFLGPRELLARDLYAVEWIACAAPPSVEPEEEFLTVARLRNASAHAWPHRGGARVRLSYHWLDAGGNELVFDGLRTDLEQAVEPGQQLDSWLSVRAPEKPGRYLLEVDPIFEHVAWFSQRTDGATCRAEVEVTAGMADGPG